MVQLQKKDKFITSIYSILKYYQVKITFESLEISLKSHFLYPSFKSFCDVLDECKIHYDVYKLQVEQLHKLNRSFVAFTGRRNNELLLVHRIEGGNVWVRNYKEKCCCYDLDEFRNLFNGLVIVINNDNNYVESNYAQKKQNNLLYNATFYIYIFLYLITGIVYYNSKLVETYLVNVVFVKILGVLFSLIIVLEEKNHEFFGPMKFCNYTKVFNCRAVLDSTYSRLYGILNVGDFSLIYFLGSLMYLLTSPSIVPFTAVAVFSLLSVLIIPLMLYIQLTRIKRLCPLCLIVQLILLVEFVFHIRDFNTPTIVVREVIIFGNFIFVTGFIIYLIKAQRMLGEKQKYYRIKLEWFLKNRKVFKSVFTSNDVDLSTQYDKLNLQLGNPKGSTKIVCCLSLLCFSCGEQIKNVRELLNESNDVSFEIYFLISDKEPLEIINTLYHISRNESEDMLIQAITEWYASRDYKKWLSRYYIACDNVIPTLAKRN